jgi:hypothetical protein
LSDDRKGDTGEVSVAGLNCRPDFRRTGISAFPGPGLPMFIIQPPCWDRFSAGDERMSQTKKASILLVAQKREYA